MTFYIVLRLRSHLLNPKVQEELSPLSREIAGEARMLYHILVYL